MQSTADMTTQYISSGKTDKIAFLVIPLASIFVFSILSFPFASIFYLLNFVYNLSFLFTIITTLIIGVIFCFFNKFFIRFCRCRNFKIALILTLIGIVISYSFFILVLVTLTSLNITSLDSSTIYYDGILVLKNFSKFFITLAKLTEGKILFIKLIVIFMIIVSIIVYYIKYVSITPYSENYSQWLKFKSFRKAINTTKDLKQITSLVKSSKFSILFSSKINNHGSNFLDFDVYYTSNFVEIVLSIDYNKKSNNKYIKFEIAKNILLKDQNANIVHNFLLQSKISPKQS
jgi:hypothetical protein